MADITETSERTADAVERLVTTLETIQGSCHIPKHTNLYQSLGEAQVFLMAQRRLVVAHNRKMSWVIRELQKQFPDGLPYAIANAVFSEVEI